MVVLSALQNLPDVTTFAANVVVFLAAVTAAVVGSMSAVKKIKESFVDAMKPAEGTVTKTQILGGLLQDTFDTKALAGSVEVNTVATNEAAEATNDLRHAVCALRDEMREHRHTMDRLIDATRNSNNVR